MKRIDLLASKEYWVVKIQLKLFHELTEYMRVNDLTKEQVAVMLGVKPPYISAILNGNFRGSIDRMVRLLLMMGRTVVVNTPTLEEYYEREQLGELNPFEVTYAHYFIKDDE